MQTTMVGTRRAPLKRARTEGAEKRSGQRTATQRMMLGRPLLAPCGERTRVQKKAVPSPSTASNNHAILSITSSTSRYNEATQGAVAGVRTPTMEECATTSCTKLTVSITRSGSCAEATTTSRNIERGQVVTPEGTPTVFAGAPNRATRWSGLPLG